VDGITLRIVDRSYDSFSTGVDRIAVVPAAGDTISIEGKPYRGLVELRVSPYGTVRPVNWIELEEYLLGVVPAELGPEVWPELAALQAQAVAARTYAWRNRGQFADEGFDLCATPRCQVYQGVAAEHPLSDRAVLATRGEILTWKDRPIVALYTATCGGHTEDGGEIFAEHDEPYLRGVPCRAESEALAAQGSGVSGRHVEPVFGPTGADVTRDWALLSVAGVLADGLLRPGSAGEPLTAEGLRSVTRSLAAISGLPEPTGPPRDPRTLAGASATLFAELGWAERARVLLSQQDLPALLRGAETAGLAPEERRAMGYLAWVEGLQPFADGRYRPDDPATLGRLAPALVRIGESYEAFGLHEGTVSGIGADSLRIVRGKGSERLPVAGDACLFGLGGGKPVPVDRLDLWPGDGVRYRTGAGGAIDFLELRPPVKGTSDDRTAKVYAWEVRRSRREVEAAIHRRVPVGTLQDLRVVRRGVSGRVVELEVVGSAGRSVIRGFDVRRLLDLRESLLVIELQRDAAGGIGAVVFAGKGWGHGVGLCQVGAYGMALRGATYREILGHYYSGAKLTRLSPAGP
jgi:stage II sporulation protein D